MLGACPAQAFLVVNGGFETGDFTGWTQSADFPATTANDSVQTAPVNSGDWAAQFGAVGALSYIAQMIPTTPAGVYTIDYYLANNIVTPGAGPPNQFKIFWDGVEQVAFTLTDSPDFGSPNNFTHFIVPGLVASSTSTELKFGFQNDPGFWNFDDVGCTTAGGQACAVPAPAALVLVGLGLVALSAIGWRRRRQA
jgi:hypothetical protein